MSFASELFQAGVKNISKKTAKFLNQLPRTDIAGAVKAVTKDPKGFAEYMANARKFAENGDQSGILPIVQKSNQWSNEGFEEATQVSTLQLGTTPQPKLDDTYKYPPFDIDETLPFDEQKRQFKSTLGNYINEQRAAGTQANLPEAYKEYGQLRNPETKQPVHLKYKKTDPKTGLRSYEPKPQETTARETAKRKSRETPWVTEKDQIKSILKEVGEEAKLAKLLKLIRTQYKAKKDAIKASGLSKGHQKALHNGGLDVPENIIGEQGVSTKEVRGNFARQYKNDPSDAELQKQGAFVGTLKEYILMKLKEVE